MLDRLTHWWRSLTGARPQVKSVSRLVANNEHYARLRGEFPAWEKRHIKVEGVWSPIFLDLTVDPVRDDDDYGDVVVRVHLCARIVYRTQSYDVVNLIAFKSRPAQPREAVDEALAWLATMDEDKFLVLAREAWERKQAGRR